MNNPSVISVKRCLDRYVAVQMSVLGSKVTGQLISNHGLNRLNNSRKYYDFGLNNYRKITISRFSPYNCNMSQIKLAIK